MALSQHRRRFKIRSSIRCLSSSLCVSKESKWRPFMLKPLPSPLMKPILVFVNPKSGGNQVARPDR